MLYNYFSLGVPNLTCFPFLPDKTKIPLYEIHFQQQNAHNILLFYLNYLVFVIRNTIFQLVKFFYILQSFFFQMVYFNFFALLLQTNPFGFNFCVLDFLFLCRSFPHLISGHKSCCGFRDTNQKRH